MIWQIFLSLQTHSTSPFWTKGRVWGKKLIEKNSRYCPFIFSKSAKVKAKINATSLQKFFCPGIHVLTILYWIPFLAVLYWQSCAGSPVLSFVLAVVLYAIFCLSCSPCPILAVLFRLSFSDCPAIAVLSGQSLLSSLFCLSCSACPVLVVMFWLSRSGYLVLAVSFWLSCSSCPVLAFFSGSVILKVLPGYLILAVLSW